MRRKKFFFLWTCGSFNIFEQKSSKNKAYKAPNSELQEKSMERKRSRSASKITLRLVSMMGARAASGWLNRRLHYSLINKRRAKREIFFRSKNKRFSFVNEMVINIHWCFTSRLLLGCNVIYIFFPPQMRLYTFFLL